jgi:glucose-6-phosphate isomerase
MSTLTGSISSGVYQPLIDTAIKNIKKNRIMSRIWRKNHRVWKDDPKEIANRLGWLHSPKDMIRKLGEINTLVNEVRADGFTQVLLLGMGGSSLAPEVLRKTFGVKEGYLDLKVLDSTDPGAVLAYTEQYDIQKTLFIVSTKSGGTVETFSFMKYFYNLVSDALGADHAGRHFIAITDPGSALADIADKFCFRKTFLNDPDIGGRYSVLSFFGMVPAALIGINVSILLDHAMMMVDHEYFSDIPDTNTLNGAVLGASLGELAKAGRDKATFVFSPRIVSFGDWLEQLIAESTGKEGRGIVPVVGEPLGSVDLYGDDRVFVHMRLEDDEADSEKLLSLEKAGHPILRMQMHAPYDLGGQFFLWEMATAVAGHCLGINPFDQPDVEAAKVLSRKMLAAYTEKGELPVETPTLAGRGIDVYGDVSAGKPEEALNAFMSQAKPGAYIALQAYVTPTDETASALRRLSTRLRDRFRLPVTVGYGPRFLHSTGQLHKGDAGKGLFIQFTCNDLKDAPIPDNMGSPDSSITFGILKNAQAFGDRKALANAGRPVIRFHLGTDTISGLKALAASIR